MSRRSVPLASLPADVRAKLKRAPSPATLAEKRLRAEQAKFRRDLFFAMLRRANLPLPEPEVRFDEDRLWKFDYAWRAEKVALEVDGGAFAGGRHTRGAGFRRDLEKLNAGVVQGWRIARVLPEQLRSKGTETMLRRLLTAEER